MKRALITGITGQDGSYLAELLLSKGYEVHGMIRRASSFNTQRIDHIYVDPHTPGARLFLHFGELSESGLLTELIYKTQPAEIYHLGAQSHVRISFDEPEFTGNITGLGTVRILEAIRRSGVTTRFYQASSSEMFGSAPAPQSENTAFAPRSPYAIAKVYAHHVSVNYREAYGLHTCNGILFNHESPRRGETFVTRKITRGLASILSGKQKILYLGNLDARRDWGFAPEFVEAMWLMLQQPRPADYVIGTGDCHTVREFLEAAFEYVGVRIAWEGDGENECGTVATLSPQWSKVLSQGSEIVRIDPRYFRPTEVNVLQADIRRAREQLGWHPRIGFRDLIKIMCDYDLQRAGIEPPGEGFALSKSKGFQYTEHLLTMEGGGR